MTGRTALLALLLTTTIGCGSSARTGDAGPPDSGGRQAHVMATVSGDRSASWDYTESHSLSGNYVDCVTDGTDFFAIEGHDYAGGHNGFTVDFHGYHGAGTYSFTYNTPGYTDLTASVDIGSYGYWYFYNYDPGAGPSADIPSSCTITVDASTTSTHASGNVSCTAFPATNISLDYVQSPTTYQPSISLSATFDCDL